MELPVASWTPSSIDPVMVPSTMLCHAVLDEEDWMIRLQFLCAAVLRLA